MPGTYSSPAESGFYYLKTRYYDPSIGRFISSDVYLSTGQGVIGNNSYAYCLNNPANCIDNTGKLANTNVMEADGGGGDIRDEISNYGPYDNSDAAAFEVAPYLYNMTKRTNQEYMAIIYSITNNGKENYYLSRIYRGDHDNVIVPFIFNVIVLSYSSYVSKGTIKIQGIVHSHPYCNGHIYNEYSGLIGDEGAALIAGSCYLVEPKLKGLYRIDRKNVINSYIYGYSISSNMELYKIGTIYGLPDYKEKYKCR